MSTVDDLAKKLLSDVAADFLAKNLGSDALSEEYNGIPISVLASTYCTAGIYSRVDFDLALKDIEARGYVKTGPSVPYENNPDSSLLIIAIVSKREFVYLTEKGYKAAQTMTAKPETPMPTVQITGGNFHQSPIGIGSVVNQAVSFNLENDSEVVEYLSKLLSQHGLNSGDETEKAVVELVTTAKTGNLANAKPVFQRLFGTTTETVKQVAWGVITAYVSTKLGI